MSIPTTRGIAALRLVTFVGFAVMSYSCGNSNDLDRSTAKSALEKTPLTFPRFRIIAASSDAQFNCAVTDGLFQKMAYNIFFPTEKGRSLGFGEADPQGPDTQTEDPDLLNHRLLTFLDGTKLKVTVDGVTGIGDGSQPVGMFTPKPGTKTVLAKVRVKAPHTCFPEPLRIWYLQLSHAEPIFPFTLRLFDDGWRIEE